MYSYIDMKKSLLKVFAVGMVICSSFSVSAQNREVLPESYVGGPFVVSVIGPTGHPVITCIYDTKNDYDLSKKFQTQEGWLYGHGEAYKTSSKETTAHVKRRAQNAAFEQILGQLERDGEGFVEDVNISGTWDGYDRNDNISKDGVRQRFMGKLPKASMQYSYRYTKNGVEYIVVGVGINIEKARREYEQAQKDADSHRRGKQGSSERNASEDALNW